MGAGALQISRRSSTGRKTTDLLAATERCVGVGQCRRNENGTMCPSYMVTLDERDSTRGRANALRNALNGRIPHEQLVSHRNA